MKITRVGKKKLEKETDRIHVELDGEEYIITEDNGKLRVHGSDCKLLVAPLVANEVLVGPRRPGIKW